MDDQGVPRGGEFDWEAAEDLTALAEDELEETLKALVEEERVLGYRRRVIQGRIDLIRAELAGRGAVSVSPDDLARVLLGEQPPGDARGAARTDLL